MSDVNDSSLGESSDDSKREFVSRGGLKLLAALEAFDLDVERYVCADLGCNVGGFTDCLLQHGAAKVFSVDTGYGTLAWKLRNDERVEVYERTNAMHVPAEVIPEGGVDLVVIDLAWTPQKHAIPAALAWKPKGIMTLIKPHYESTHSGGKRPRLSDEEAEVVMEETLGRMTDLGVVVKGCVKSPIRGGKSKGKAGNVEYLAYVVSG